MKKYLIQLIGEYINNNNNEMNVFLELIKKTINKKGFNLNEQSNTIIINKAKQVMMIKNDNENNGSVNEILGNIGNSCFMQSNLIKQYLPNKLEWINGILIMMKNYMNKLINYNVI